MTVVAETQTSVTDVFAAVSQEILVLVVFFVSLLLWRHVGQRQKAGKQQRKTLSSPPCSSSAPTKKGRIDTASAKGDGKLEGKPPHAILAAEEQMLKLLEQREFTRALNYFRTFERDQCRFSEALYAAFIQSAIRVGKIDVVERMLRLMKRRGTAPTCDFLKATLKMLSSRKHFDTCLTIYNIFGRLLPVDKVIYSCLINGALESGSADMAATMLDRYSEADLEPKDHVLLFRTYVATNNVDAAEKVFNKLGTDMTSLMTNLLLLACINAKQPDRALDRLREARVFQEKRASEAKSESQESEPIVDVVSYNTVIKGFAQAGMLPRCFDCLHEMRSHGLEPDDVTFGTLLDMCIADNDMKSASEVVDLLVRGERPVDTVMCTLFIKGFVRAQKLPQAIELYEEMKRRNCTEARPDIVTYSVMIKAFVDAHDLEKALHLVEDLTHAGHVPDDIILTHLLEGCRYVGNHALGKRLFEDMLAAGVKPSEFTLITMVKLHGRCGAHEEAYQLVSTWEQKHGAKPSVIHYTCLMSGCLRTKNYDQAWRAYQLMLEMKVQPDETTMATLFPGMVAAQQWDRTLALARYAFNKEKPVRITREMLNNALSQMRAASGQMQNSMDLERMMIEAHVPVSARPRPSAAR